MKHTFTTSALIVAIFLLTVAAFEPDITNAVEVQDTVLVNLQVDEGISITTPPDVTMSNMGTTLNNSTGSAVWNVKTNAAGGYELFVKATTSPALVSGSNSFADYTEAVAGTPDNFSVNAGSFEFGFSGIGADVQNVLSDQYAATGVTTCDDGAASSTVNTNLKFLGFETDNQLLARKTSTTTTSGVDSKICFAAGQNGVFAPSGVYQATITATAVTL